MSNRFLPLSVLSLTIIQLSTLHASNWEASQTDFGGVGLMQMPSARFAPEGSFALGGAFNSDYHFYHISLQLMPWLETTIRYTNVPDIPYSPDSSFSGDNSLADKSFDLKLQLLRESYWFPEIALGLRDIGGTGLFDGEYVAASKRFGSFDFTLGVGWGYLGNSANLSGSKTNNSQCGRDTTTSGQGGLVEYEKWFDGCVALFGGIEYQTPWQPLRLKIEYDGNDYQSDVLTQRGIPIIQESKVNYGIIYQFDDWGELQASFERGNTWTLGFALKSNFDTLSQPKIDHKDPAYVPKETNSPIDWEKTAKELGDVAGYRQATIYANDEQVTVVASQNKYRNREKAHSRAATVLANTGTSAPRYSLIETESSLPISQTNIDANKFKQFINQENKDIKLSDALTYQSPSKYIQGNLRANLSKPWSFGLSPVLAQSFGGSEDFYLFNVGISASGNYWLADKLSFGGDVYVNLFDNYDKLLYETPPDGTDLKRVRTLVRQYISDNPIRLSNLQATYFDQLGDNFYTQIYAGYLESMFAGVGGELLYRPFMSNWAFGLDLNYVIQRDPDSQFALFDKESHVDPATGRAYRVQTGTVTGHLTTYYRPKWDYFSNLLFKFSAGQYLTEDIGATLDISKQFKSGVIVGAYAAKTNLSSEEFGEGSFNKGFYISIPIDALTVNSSTNRGVIHWAPLTRDGGQMLRRKYSLYNLTSSRYQGSELTNQ